MQGRFSDSPYFMIRDFFDEIRKTKHNNLPEIDYNWEVTFVSTFTDAISAGSVEYKEGNWSLTDGDPDDIVYTDFATNIYNILYHFNPNEQHAYNSYIVSPFVNITTHGNGIVNLYVKEPDEGYIPISIKHLNTKGDRFNFSTTAGRTLIPGDTIVETLSGASYYFGIYNTNIHNGFSTYFNNNRETYWRKDSLFHAWLRKYAQQYYLDKLGVKLDIRNYVNYDKIFLLFHRIFKSHDERTCRIIFYGMKNFVMDAIPEHQRTPKFKEFMDIFFDELYQEHHNQVKDIWHLLDAMMTSFEYLGYLSKFYDMFDVDQFDIKELQLREFVRDMIWILKRKGTYTDYFVLWRILTDTTNRLNIYERWHTKSVENWPNWPAAIDPQDISTWPNYPYYSDTNGATNVPEDEWYDTNYILKPEYHHPPVSGGAGPVYYQDNYPCSLETYESSNMLLSTHYIVEIDVNNEPMDNDAVISKKTWDNISSYWEYLRPVNRVSHYRIVLAPITNFSCEFVPLYHNLRGKTAFVQSKCEYYYPLVTGAYIHKQDTPSNEWIVHHNLGGNVHIQVFDDMFDEMIPSDIVFDSNSVLRILFDSETTGFALIKVADSTDVQSPVVDIWNIVNTLNNDKLIINFEEDQKKSYEGSLELISPAESMATFSETSIHRRNVTSEGNFVFFQNTPATEWDVVHNLGTNGVLMNVYDMNNQRMNPSEFELVNTERMKLYFDNPQDGYVVLLRVGNFNLDNFDFGDVTIRLYEHIGDMVDGIPPIYTTHADWVLETEDAYYIQRTIPQEETFTFNEIAIYHENGELIFYTKCSDVYNPRDVMLTLHYRIEKTT
jgi:hypothetical protein